MVGVLLQVGELASDSDFFAHLQLLQPWLRTQLPAECAACRWPVVQHVVAGAAATVAPSLCSHRAAPSHRAPAQFGGLRPLAIT